MGSIHQDRKLFTPLQVGDTTLSHRVIMSPLTRVRCPGGIPSPDVAEYYAQRATLGGLIISEGMHPSFMGGNLHNIPSMYSPEHIRSWRVVTDAVHARGGYMVCQLWHIGRFGTSHTLGGRQPLSASATNSNLVNRLTPKGQVPTETAKEMTLEDIRDTIEDHVHAAKCAIAAGFDGVEISSANGYLFDQFLNDRTNLRKDHYGGTEENRARFILETLDAMAAEIGHARTAVRFSPWGTVMMPLASDPISNWTYVLSEVEKRGLAYVCLTQPRADLFLSSDKKLATLAKASEDGIIAAEPEDIHLKHFEKVLKDTPTFATGEYDGTNCFDEVEKEELDGVTFGRWFISNPDLVEKIRLGLRLTPWDQTTFYTPGPKGYTDYPVGEVDPSGL
ncbi:NADH-flavin oxidoreductase/NADH oxidase [Mollisia scopiformis]|uniref:NADH-flavin oxidoreductase/NADH oxidase n=1 Tax=Mollisia scopiformis TaxID=149040 RepID=A0A194XUU5_MOLSC|nr:NADH-flavin oxidoreductase/NADH oxidase [Mollisia scopiformis]KUJ23809.1 NADH-flavin oxidoreductase/NADH oxidase [Mollisia scopiformis]